MIAPTSTHTVRRRSMPARLGGAWGALLRRARWGMATGWARLTLDSVGPGSVIENDVLITAPALVSLGAGCRIAEGVRLSSECGGSLTLRDRVQLNRHVTVDHSGGVVIGDDVILSSDVLVYTHTHGYDPKSVPMASPLTIGPHAWIGARALILPSVGSIGEYAVIGAGAVVTHDVPAWTVVAGNPARPVTERPHA